MSTGFGLREPEGARAIVKVARSSQILTGLVISGAIAIIPTVLIGLLVALPTVAGILLPVATLGASFFGAAAAAVAVVLVAIILTVFQGIFVFTAAAIPDKLQEALTQSAAPVVLRDLVETEGARVSVMMVRPNE